MKKILFFTLYDNICLSTRSFGYSLSKKIISLIKRVYDIPVIGGGWGPTLEPAKFLEFCDYVCFGEGEAAISQISRKLSNDENDIHTVDNLFFRRNGTIIKNRTAHPLCNADLKQLPLYLGWYLLRVPRSKK